MIHIKLVEAMKVVKISKSKEIHVQVTEVAGKRTLDVRTYVITKNYTGYTKKGVNIPIEKGGELALAIKEVTEGEGNGGR